MKYVTPILLVIIFFGLFALVLGVMKSGLPDFGGELNIGGIVPGVITDEAADIFRTQMFEETRTRVGQPIEGYEPFMLMQAFPNLIKQDFHGVEALLGVYQYKESDLVFILDRSMPEHSAARAISEKGMTTLLKNVSTRLTLPAKNATDVESILVALRGNQYETGVFGRISGVLSIGPICPVEREGVPCPVPAEAYRARPIVVYDTNGNEVTRVTASTVDGTFMIEVSAGTYDIGVESASAIERTPKQRVTIGSDQDISIRFDVDTGIR